MTVFGTACHAAKSTYALINSNTASAKWAMATRPR